jgi:hypothetical protein
MALSTTRSHPRRALERKAELPNPPIQRFRGCKSDLSGVGGKTRDRRLLPYCLGLRRESSPQFSIQSRKERMRWAQLFKKRIAKSSSSACRRVGLSFAGCRARSNRRDGWLVVCSFAAPGPSRPAPARFVLPPCPLSSSSSSPRRAISSDRGPPPRGQKKPDCQPPPIICYFRTEMEPTLIQAPPGASTCVGGVTVACQHASGVSG